MIYRYAALCSPRVLIDANFELMALSANSHIRLRMGGLVLLQMIIT